MLSDLYASIRYLETQIQNLFSKNHILSQDCSELDETDRSLGAVSSAQDRLMARQRSAWANPVFGSSRSAQMMRNRMESVISSGAGRAARIGLSASDVVRKRAEKKKQISDNESTIHSYQAQISSLYYQAQAEAARIAAQGGN